MTGYILLQANNKSYSLKSIDKTYETKMTSNTTPSPLVASASSSNSSSLYLAWYAFNGVNATNNCWASTAADRNTCWLQIDFGDRKVFNTVYITARDNSSGNTNQMIKDFKLLGSNDGTDWDHIAAFNNQTNWSGFETRAFRFKSKKYRYYRIQASSNNGNTNATSIGNVLFSYNTLINEIPDASIKNFAGYGSAEINDLNLIQSSKNYVLQDESLENEIGLRSTRLDRKPLGIQMF